jgi:hypothetical protein
MIPVVRVRITFAVIVAVIDILRGATVWPVGSICITSWLVARYPDGRIRIARGWAVYPAGA